MMAIPHHIRIAALAAAMAAALCFTKLHAAPDPQPLIWLKTGNNAALENYLEGLQKGYESGSVSEYRLYEAFRALYEDGVDNSQYFDHWVEAYPNSYAAHTARGAYYYRLAGYLRGDDYVSQTPPPRIQQMHTNLIRARPELHASLKLTAKPYLSTLYLLNIARLDGTADERQHWLDAGNAIAPNNELLRLRYMNCLTPRWGGSLKMMRDFRTQSQRKGATPYLLTRLDIMIHTETAESFKEQDDLPGALNEWDQVLKLSAANGQPATDEVLIAYARTAWKLHRPADADRALQQLAPRQIDKPWLLSNMGWIYIQEGRMAEAWTVIQRAAALNDPWAQFSVGKTTYLGCADINLPPNQTEGLVWIRRSAQQGFAEAKTFLLEHGG